MLTADLVDARKKDRELVLRTLDAKARRDASVLASNYLETARAFVGRRRGELEEAWDSVNLDLPSQRFKLAAGLRKLAGDVCTFEAEASIDAAELRRALFTRASEARRALRDGDRFDRTQIIMLTAESLGIAPDALESSLFSDLRSEHVLRAAPTLAPEQLVEAWELGQAQAVLLSAVRIACEVASGSPGLVRAFFSKLKFHKLLFSAERVDPKPNAPEGWRIIIDGPYSMFDAVTKYGLRLAILLPALRALEQWTLVADVRWGKAREPLIFQTSSVSDATGRHSRSMVNEPELHVSDDVRELAAGIDALGTEWTARPATVLLDIPGLGVCIPDLVLSREGSPSPVYIEVLGYWSRDAVFRRVELAERGLGVPIIFAVSSRLRVSAEVLDESVGASLYVYKGKISPRAIIDRAVRISSVVARIPPIG